MADQRIADQRIADQRYYVAACKALAECVAIDKCNDWADKAQALAAYAKQANDSELECNARRIRARAYRRFRQLLHEGLEAQGARTDPPLPAGGARKLTRAAAASAAGLSERQRVTAERIARLPSEEFDGAVEGSDTPASITNLAERGKQYDGLDREAAKDRREAYKLRGLLMPMLNARNKIDLEAAVRGWPKQDQSLRSVVPLVRAFMDEISDHVGK